MFKDNVIADNHNYITTPTFLGYLDFIYIYKVNIKFTYLEIIHSS